MPMYCKIEGNGMGDLRKGLSFLKSHRVLVGIPQANDENHGNLTNVQLAFIMSKGSPKKGIPPRPFLEPTFDDSGVKNRIAREMGNAVKRSANGDYGGAMMALGQAGTIGRDAVKNSMGGTPPPNSPATAERKRKKRGDAVTLIDTAQLQGSIIYIIE